MKKFFILSLGVIAWLNTAVVNAVEKFEVLPDLPDPLAYAVQPVSATTISGATDVANLGSQSIGNEPSVVSVLFSLAFVVLLIYLTGILYTKLNKVGFKTLKRQQGDLSRSQVSVISTTQLGNNKTLHVVELDGKRMLIGASSGAIQLIKDLGSFNGADALEEEFSHIEIPNIKIPKIEIPKIEIPAINFSKLVTKTHKPISKVEIDVEKDESESLQEVIEKPQADVDSEVIIDSLFAQSEEPVQELEEDKTTYEHKVDPEDYALYKKYLG